MGPRPTYRQTSITVTALAETAKPSTKGRRPGEMISATAVGSTASARDRTPSLMGAGPRHRWRQD
jgi:hypothetical protein